jgi:hypothetical protein
VVVRTNRTSKVHSPRDERLADNKGNWETYPNCPDDGTNQKI